MFHLFLHPDTQPFHASLMSHMHGQYLYLSNILVLSFLQWDPDTLLLYLLLSGNYFPSSPLVYSPVLFLLLCVRVVCVCSFYSALKAREDFFSSFVLLLLLLIHTFPSLATSCWWVCYYCYSRKKEAHFSQGRKTGEYPKIKGPSFSSWKIEGHFKILL